MKDIVYVEHQHYVSVRKNSFRLVNQITKDEVFIPIDEVEWLVFDNERSYFSKRVITVSLEEDIGILFCNQKHVPQVTVVNEYGHSKKLERLINQISFPKKVKQRLWKKIVVEKINNQAGVLDYVVKKTKQADKLREISKTVDQGDQRNREAYAARQYFVHIFGSDFKRGRYEDPINASLNYSYALIRATIRKELAFFGLEPSIGIEHRSTENPFNLSDDFIEPFRPFVDAFVYERIYLKEVQEITLEIKKEMLEIFFEKCIIDGKIYTVTDAVRVSVESYIACLKDKSSAPLKLPRFIEVGR